MNVDEADLPEGAGSVSDSAQLTALERAALAEICRQEELVGAALALQLATATVIERENTGAGFFTVLAIDRSVGPVASCERVLGDVAATIEGFEQPMLLMLFMSDGYAEFIEGATLGDGTSDIDLATIGFTIEKAGR